MGQVCIRESQPFEMVSEQRLQKLQTKAKKSTRQLAKDSQYSEYINSNNIAKEFKMTIKKSKREDSDTEDESSDNYNSGSQISVLSEETISHHKNNDQDIDDISPKSSQISDKQNKSKAQSSSSKKSSNTRKQQKSMVSNKIFTGTLGYGNYLEYSQNNQYYFDDNQIKQNIQRQKRVASEAQNKKQNGHKSILSDNSE